MVSGFLFPEMHQLNQIASNLNVLDIAVDEIYNVECLDEDPNSKLSEWSPAEKHMILFKELIAVC